MQDLFHTLPAILNDVEGAEAVREAIVFAAWKRIAGERLAAQTVPLRLDGKKLMIAVSTKTWQRHLADLSPQMLFKLNATVGDRSVEFIEFVIDTSEVEKAKTTIIESTDDAARSEITRKISDAAQAIGDESLREQFLAAAANCLARKRRMTN